MRNDLSERNNNSGSKVRKKTTTTSFYSKLQTPTIRHNSNSDRYPNDNLFKADKHYRMTKYLDFELQEEQSFQQMHRRLFSLKIEHLSILCVLRVLYHCNYESSIDYYKGTYYMLSFALSYYCIRIAHSNNDNLKLFLTLLFIINSVISIISKETPSVLSIQYIASELFFAYVNGMFLNLSLVYILLFFIAITVIHITKATVSNISDDSLLKYIKAFNAANGLLAFSALVFFLLIYYYYLKAKRELWALLDSFKKSYQIFDGLIFKECMIPCLVLSKSFCILSANQPAVAFLAQIKDNKHRAGKRGINTQNENIFLNSNLLDFISPSLKDSFIMRFNRCLTEKMQRFCFYFDFSSITNKSKPNGNMSSASLNHSLNEDDNSPHKEYQSDEKKKIKYMVIPSRCLWKNQESYVVRICEEAFESSFYDYILSYSKFLIEELLDFTHCSDKLCERLIDSEITYDQYNLLLNKINNRNISGNEQETFNKIIQQRVLIENSLLPVVNESSREGNESFNSHNHFFNKAQKATFDQLFPSINHSILFYFKNQSEVYYDLQLTKEIYSSIMLQTLSITSSQLDLKSLANYFEDYFYMILRIKHIKLRFMIKCDCTIVVEYSFLRTVMFNTLMFIHSNTDDESDSSEKSIIYTITLEKEPKISSEMFDKTKTTFGSSKANDDFCYDLFCSTNTHVLRFSIVIWDDKHKANYNEILKELQIRSCLLFNEQEQIDKVKKFDISLMTLFYVITAVYSKELEMYSKEGEHTIAFEIGCGIAKQGNADTSVGNPNANPVMQFIDINTNISDPYYKDILRRVYHINIPDDELKEKRNNTFLAKASRPTKSLERNKDMVHQKKNKNDIRSSVKTTQSKDSSPNFFSPESDDKDLNQCKSFKLNLPKPLFSTKSLLFTMKPKLSIEPSFFSPPRFLIVEDNQFARTQLINLITELSKDYRIVIAEDGNVAMTKLKKVYDKRRLYHIVFMDMNLPFKNGSEIAKSIRNTEKDYPPGLQTKIIGISINPNEKMTKSQLFNHYSKHLSY